MRLSIVIITVICVLIVAIIIFRQAWETIERPIERVWDVDNLTLKDFAYVEGATTPHKVFIEENGAPTPYLVLTDNYNGNCLLLREYVFGEKMIYSRSKPYRAYYGDSDIDAFLNSGFIKMFQSDLSESIVNTDIVITATSSLSSGVDEVETINRKAFLLSYTEINMFSEAELKRKNWGSIRIEGEPLSYFKDADARRVTLQNGTATTWVLRTPDTSATDLICVVTRDGWVGISGVSTIAGEGEDMGVLWRFRPAFCLPGNMKVTKTIDEDGEKYVLQ